MASLIGSPGQSNYTVANAGLDAIARYRQSLNLPALSINWGAWANSGMAVEQGNEHQGHEFDRARRRNWGFREIIKQ